MADPGQPRAGRPPVRSTHPTAQRARPAIIGVVAAGGALGTAARGGIGRLVEVAPGSFPWGTFWVNVTGSFALGLVLGLVIRSFPDSRYLRPFLATGILGSFTTYSTFVVETGLLTRNGNLGVAAAYALATIFVGLGATAGGLAVGRVVALRRRSRPARAGPGQGTAREPRV